MAELKEKTKQASSYLNDQALHNQFKKELIKNANALEKKNKSLEADNLYLRSELQRMGQIIQSRSSGISLNSSLTDNTS